MVTATDVKEILNSASIKGDFLREKFDEKSMPDNLQKIIVIPIFGDINHIIVFANYIFHGLRNDINLKDKYIIVVTWKGFAKFFPQANEVWSSKSIEHADKFYEKTEGLINKYENLNIIYRSLNEYFRNVIDPVKFSNQFHFGFKKENIKNKNVEIIKNKTPNINYLNKNAVDQINALGEKRVFIIPFKFLRQLSLGKIKNYKPSYAFYVNTIDSLIKKNINCVVLKNYLTFDLSKNYLENKNVVMVQEDDWFNIMAYMLATGVYVDLFAGISSLAIYCGCPSVTVVERNMHVVSNQEEIEMCMNDSIIDRKLFSFFELNYNLIDKKLFFIDKLVCQIDEVGQKDSNKINVNNLKYNIDLNKIIVEKTKKLQPKFIGLNKKVIGE
jgi:hypothetical protein